MTVLRAAQERWQRKWGGAEVKIDAAERRALAGAIAQVRGLRRTEVTSSGPIRPSLWERAS